MLDVAARHGGAGVSFDGLETSTQDGQPVELYKFVLSGRTFYMTTAEEDVQFGGFTWQATPGLSRSPITLQQVGKARTLDVTLERTNSAARVLISNGIPPRTATLLIRRVHRGDTDARQIWSGNISKARLEGVTLHLTVPNAMDVQLGAELPFVEVSGTCQHILYGTGCGVDRNYLTYETQGFLVATTAASQTGDVLTVADMDDAGGTPHPDQWARFGEVRRLVDGERRTILDHTGTALTLDVPFAYLTAGDELEVWAGCDHKITVYRGNTFPLDVIPGHCDTKFSNGPNFGGHPEAPLSNPVNPQDES